MPATRIVIATVDRLFVWVRSKPLLYRVTLFTRIMLAAGFIPTGLVKLLGQRFTLISVNTPAGAFFEAMYETGLFWRFIGAAQVFAGLLLLVPAVAHLGALLFLPIVGCITVITIALSFGNTVVVVSGMLAAVLYLLLWDYDRVRSTLTTRPLAMPQTTPEYRLDKWERAGFAVFAGALLTFFLFTRSFVPAWVSGPAVVVGVVAGLVALVRFVVVSRHEV